MLALWIALGVVSYLNTGYWWGRLSWKVWRKKQRSVAGLLCFPVSYVLDKIGNEDGSTHFRAPPIAELITTEDAYTNIMAIAWPGKVLWNLAFLTFFAASKLPSKTLRLVVHPTSLFPKQITKELPAPPPAEHTPIQSDSYSESKHDEYQRILTQHNNDVIRLKELEAELEENKKVVRLPKRM